MVGGWHNARLTLTSSCVGASVIYEGSCRCLQLDLFSPFYRQVQVHSVQTGIRSSFPCSIHPFVPTTSSPRPLHFLFLSSLLRAVPHIRPSTSVSSTLNCRAVIAHHFRGAPNKTRGERMKAALSRVKINRSGQWDRTALPLPPFTSGVTGRLQMCRSAELNGR